ncbi:COBRA-like protein 10 [Abeliophyllum distichum]|uniref:COBRA-like protein 10 n=1 Tax=Abeliophyllum distichum TaxID=126358 RepID=A0ABD1QJ58_9LAMI
MQYGFWLMQDCINRITSLENMGRLSGVMDDRGKYIYISLEEMKAVADYIKREGRVNISHLASKSNQFIDLEPKAQLVEDISSIEETTVADKITVTLYRRRRRRNKSTAMAYLWEKVYPLVKNISAQGWSFKAMATVLNAGYNELKSWKVYIGFWHNELLVSADGAEVVDGDGFPILVRKNGTVLAGDPQSDLETAINTAGDYTQMMAQINLKGTQFGLKPSATPMPKTIKLVNDGYKCPVPEKTTICMYVVRGIQSSKRKKVKTKFLPRQYGELSFTYDVLQAYENKYLAQVTVDNNHPLGRMDQWNLTWEWMRNEFIYSMKGAYTHKKDPSECIFGPQGQSYKDFDFSSVMNCQ